MSLTDERRRVLKASGVLFGAVIAAFLVFYGLMAFVDPNQNLPYAVMSVVMPILFALMLLGPGVVVLLLVFHWYERPSAGQKVLQALFGILGSTVLSIASFSLLFHRDGPNDYGFIEFFFMQLWSLLWWGFWAGVTLVVLLMVWVTGLKRIKTARKDG